ncbi:MAG: serine hydrolase domain-containing protein [Candidatus Thorarchaeota archaeon]
MDNRRNSLVLQLSILICIIIMAFLLHFPVISTSFKQTKGSYSLNSSYNNISRDYWPTVDWINSTPEAQCMNSTLLNQMVDYIYEQEFNLDSIIIVKNGYIVLEEYPSPRYHQTSHHILYSVTKSVTSALIGIAIDKGYIEDVNQTVVDYFPNRTIQNLDSRKQQVTIEHLLTMSAGFEWVGPDLLSQEYSWGQAVFSGNPIEFILNLPMEYDPGTTWYYNGGCSHLLSAILTVTTGNSTLEFARENLFDPLGINSVYWPKDDQGIYYGGQNIGLKPRDMAKFGYLFLNNGTWDGKQIISKEWVATSTETRFVLNHNGYGYQWWTFFPHEIYFAWGLFEQKIIIVPDYDLVIVFTASIKDGPDPEPELVFEYILPAVLDECTTTSQTSSDGINSSNSHMTTNTITNKSPHSLMSIFLTFIVIILYKKRQIYIK